MNGIVAAIAIAFTVFMVLNPEPAFGAALRGLRVWWDIVFPALLPFFVGSEILMGLGVVHFMGVLLEPLMRPLFNVPGAGSFVLAMGLASGYPIGAMLTARLRDQDLCTPIEGERLMAFANTADPLFMTGVVDSHRTARGRQLAALRILVRITEREIRREAGETPPSPPAKEETGNTCAGNKPRTSPEASGAAGGC